MTPTKSSAERLLVFAGRKDTDYEKTSGNSIIPYILVRHSIGRRLFAMDARTIDNAVSLCFGRRNINTAVFYER